MGQPASFFLAPVNKNIAAMVTAMGGEEQILPEEAQRLKEEGETQVSSESQYRNTDMRVESG